MAGVGLGDGAVLILRWDSPVGVKQQWLPSSWGGLGEFVVEGAGVGSVNPLIIDILS